MQDTCRIHQDTYCIGTLPNLYRKPPLCPDPPGQGEGVCGERSPCRLGYWAYHGDTYLEFCCSESEA